jgi:hypothetical protein
MPVAVQVSANSGDPGMEIQILKSSADSRRCILSDFSLFFLQPSD